MLLNSGDKKSAEKEVEDLKKQVKDLEGQLTAERTSSKKALEDAQSAAALREKEYDERLLTLVRAAGG